MDGLEVSVLGALEVRRDGTPLDLGTPKQRALVTALALAHGWPVSVDGIIDHLWGDDAPPGVTGTLQAYVSQLRRVLEPDRAPRTPATLLVTAAPGYALKVADAQVDARVFEHAVTSAHKVLQGVGAWGTTTLDRATLESQRAALAAALGTWRGAPYADLGDAEGAANERTRLEALRLVALEDDAVAALALGEHGTVASGLEALCAAHPLRERLWALRAVALVRSGRQADALEVLRRLRDVLDEELGIEPSAELRDLQTAVLRQDERLEWSAPPGGTPAPPPSPGSRPVAPQAPPPGTSRSISVEDNRVAPWPMVGRDADLAALTSLLGAAASGRPSYAVLTGDPGIGKSRLAAELLLQARRRDTQVLVGRCSQDEGAPPLWPWAAVLSGLGADLRAVVAEEGDRADRADEGGRFRAWERIAAVVREAARQRPTVLLLDDLHWADDPTLRVLRLLVDSLSDERLLVLATWRSHPAPAGALADVAEHLARHHAHRVELQGLPTRDAGVVFEAVAGTAAAGADAGLLRERTDGNPFFLVELARLAGERGGGVDLATATLPAAVGEVIDRRVDRLPEATVAALRTAAVIGRGFDLGTLASAAGLDEDDALDVVEPAQAAGLLRERGVDRYAFTHALLRDRLREGIGASRLARVHARVARALDEAGGRESEAALHWLAAGPAHAARAWRAAVAAAATARDLHDHEQAGQLLAGALASMDADPSASLGERFDVLMELAEAHKWAVRTPDLIAVVEQAIGVGKELRDPALVARAALAPSTGVLWRSAPAGETNEIVVGALRGSLERLPDGDGELRCRTLLALALEMAEDEYDRPGETSDELARAGREMADRLGDPALRLAAGQLSFISNWRPSNAEERLGWATDALRIAGEIGDERAAVVSGTLRAMALGELGRTTEMAEQAPVTRALADRLKIAYGDLMLSGLEAVWAAVSGRFDDCDRALARIHDLGDRLDHESTQEATGAAMVVIAYWRGDAAAAVPVLDMFVESGWPFAAPAAVHHWLAGDEDGARALLAEHGPPPPVESQLTLYLWGHAAELALYLGDADLAASAIEWLAPYAGRPVTVGGAIVMAPVDAYLALAHAALGRREEAAAHAEAAVAQAGDWGAAAVPPWLASLRATYSF